MTNHVNRRTFLKGSGTVLGGIAAGTTVVAAERTDRFIVQTKGNRRLRGLDVVHEMPGVRFAVVRGAESAVKRSSAVRAYAPDVEIDIGLPAPSERAPTVEESTVGDEPLYGLQWDKQHLDVSTAHETTTGAGSMVTVIDTGVAAGHPDLDVDVGLSQNFTGDGLGAGNPAGGYHGTHVGGIVAASENDKGVIGTAPDTTLVDCRVFSPGGLASFADILAALVYSANIGADAANMSIGAYPISRQGLGSFYGKVVNAVFTYANRQGTLPIVSAGNDGADLQHDKNVISLPNEAAQAMSIAATGPIGFGWDATSVGDTEEPAASPASYTNYGTNAVDLAAPGGDASPAGIAEEEDGDSFKPAWYLDLVLNSVAMPTYETDSEGNVTGIESVAYSWSWVAGTSMAAPQVAGAAALVKSANPGLNANQVQAALTGAATVPSGYGKEYYGSGSLNVVDAL